MRTELRRRPHPLLAVLPVGLFAAVLIVDLAALVSGFTLFATIALGVLWTMLACGLVALTALLVSVTIAPVGSASRLASGTAAATTCAMVIGFAIAAWLRTGRDPAGSPGLFLLQLAAVMVGAAGVALAPTADPRRAAWQVWLAPAPTALESPNPWFPSR